MLGEGIRQTYEKAAGQIDGKRAERERAAHRATGQQRDAVAG